MTRGFDMKLTFIVVFVASTLLVSCGGGGTSATLGPIISSTEYSGSTQSIRYSDGSTVTNTATSSPVSWASDHITKTITHTFANGGTNPVVSTVAGTAGSPTYSGSTQSIVTTYGDGFSATANNAATSSPVSWASDHITKTITHTFANGGTNPVVSTEQGVTSGAALSTSAGINSTSSLTTRYGDGHAQVLQDGSTQKPFQQNTLSSTSNSDPNAIVATTSQNFDLRWGSKATPYVLATTDDVGLRMTSTTATLALTGGLYQTISFNPNLDSSTTLGIDTSAIQGVWITPDVKSAWSQGWTGSGVKIGVIDDFTADNKNDFKSISLPTGCSYESGVYLCSSTNVFKVQLTHGEQVSLIAGGSKSSFSGGVRQAGAWAYQGAVGSYVVNIDLSVSLSSPLFGVAKDAEMYRSDFLTYQSHTNGLFSVMKNWGVGADVSSQRYRDLKVVNLSLGGTSANPVTNVANYQSQLAYANASVVPDAVFVKAAGNNSCVVSLSNCDPHNAVFYFSPQYKEKSLLVGALNQAGGSIAPYSNKAGTFVDRFLVADGRGIENFDGTYDQGTSFAAPRVAGYAAILRQKFPNLNAANTSNVILDTASWNNSWGAKDTTVQAIYGQGEASLSRALAPVGRLR